MMYLQLDSELQGKPWSPSAPPEGFTSPGSSVGSPGRLSSAQGLRKSRASARTNTGTSLRADSASPASLSASSSPGFGNSNGASKLYDQKAANESYFATLGSANASRPEDLPPSQGGRYQGFGNTPSPPMGGEHPSYGLSSRAAPTLSELQENPLGALSKGWSLFSSAVVGASRAVSENVIQPSVEKVTDPNFQAGVRGYVSEAGRRAGEVGSLANNWGKTQLGVDVAGQVGGVVGGVRDRIGGPSRSGYDSLSTGHGQDEHSALYQDEDEDDFFGEYSNGGSATGHYGSSGLSSGGATGAASTGAANKKAEDWDEWKDF